MAKKKRTRKKRSRGAEVRKPIKSKAREELVERPDEGPGSWFLSQIEESYTRLAPVGAPNLELPERSPPSGVAFESAYEAGAGEAVLGQGRRNLWCDVLGEYRRRKMAVVAEEAAAVAPPAPIVPGGRNWRPLGPRVVLNGQTVGEHPVAGRVSGIAIAPGGNLLYVATAAGGVFRSDDAASSWKSCMDGFDVDPIDFASASLACGAIAIDPVDPERVYVGTGEGDTHELFRSRVVNALPAYRGIGPIRSDNGGAAWVTEQTASDSPDLAGDAFFALAVDPRDRENVLAATTIGLYQRIPAGGGAFEWTRHGTGVFSDVVVAATGSSVRFFAAHWGNGVFHSTNGTNWSRTGTGFPTNQVGRIALGVQPGNPGRVYAFVAKTDGNALGLFRLDAIGGSWKNVSSVPAVLHGQGGYDLTIAVDPNDEDIVYLGGDHMGAPPWAGSVWRCPIKPSGSSYRVSGPASIGTHAHSDVHKLVHTPGEPDELWCGCDGGLFLNRNPRGSGQFGSRNEGLSCLCCNFIAQHSTDPNILFSGLQDNGTARTASGPAWSHVNYGDGGYCLINWADPNQVLSFANGTIYRSTTGGSTHGAWSTKWDFPWATMTQPIVGPPYNPSSPGDAKLVAAAAGTEVRCSQNFAASWSSSLTIFLPSGSRSVFALAFANPNRLFLGTTNGQVFRADRSGNSWSLIRLDNVTPGGLGLQGLITDIAVDWNDTNHQSIYVCFGGLGDHRRVWYFDGSQWEVRSGTPGGGDLLDVEHNAMVVDANAPDNVYVGADIGVWHSPDAGSNWAPLQNGLPDAPVFDLQIHPTQRLLRAATHGRGVYEIRLA